MKNLSREIDANFKSFSASSHAEMLRVYDSLGTLEPRFQSAYRRLVSLQAWKSELLERQMSPEALSFFLEAQNDGLVSLVLARLGSCRAALQSLRSCMENAMFAAFYMDHPVEMQLWGSGKHRLNFTQLEAYFAAHPQLDQIDPAVHSLQQFKEEFSTLSRAVHGSAASFRMSEANIGTQLWSDDPARLGKYETRQKLVVGSVNLLYLCLFRSHLQGAALLNLRKAISFAVSVTLHAKVRSALGVSLLRP